MAINTLAINKAKIRLATAIEAADRLQQTTDYATTCGVWYTFLVAAKGIYNALEQGAKETPQDRQWYGEVKRIRRGYELLQYVFQARNDDEHSLAEVTERVAGHTMIGFAPGTSRSFTIRDLSTDEDGRITTGEIFSHDGKTPLIRHVPTRAALREVTGRSGEKFQPPVQHLGQPLENQEPHTIARLAVHYLSSLLEEASSRA